MGDVSYVRALEPTARSGAHGFRSRRSRSLLTCSTIVGLGLGVSGRPAEAFPAEFIDDRFVKQLSDEGLVKQLYPGGISAR
jgi:hypothetical protein